MSVATAASGADVATAPAAGESCPLCGAPLHGEQEWCLRCGAAARTRLSASPNWKAPVAAVAAVAALSLGVLAAAVVKLAGNESSSAKAGTTIVTTAPAASAPSTTPPAGAPGTSTPGATVPGAGAATASTPSTAPSTSMPSTTTPESSRSARRLRPLLQLLKLKAGRSPSLAERERIAKLLSPGGK